MLQEFDAAKYLDNPEAIAGFIEGAFEMAAEEGDPSIITMALGVIARAKGMTALARESGMTREGLYKALGENGDPRLSTLMGVMSALGLTLSATGKEAA
ncbi:putative addiction module antidote protein [Salipiger pacificus]|nr:putative addiction module antidote protein [Alloyangia pacifica]